MLAADAGDHAVARRGHGHERREFAGMVGADLEDGGLVMRLQPEQGQGHANVVVETRLAPERGMFLAQHGGDQLLRRGLAVGAAHDDGRQLEIRAVLGGQPAERLPGVFDGNDGATQRQDGQACRLDNHRGNFPPPDLGQKIVAVKFFPGQGDEQIPGPRLARIRADAPHHRLRCAGQLPPRTGGGDVLQIPWFHSRIFRNSRRAPDAVTTDRQFTPPTQVGGDFRPLSCDR